MTETSYSYARENLAALWDEVEDSREEIILTRRGHEDLALARSRAGAGAVDFKSIEALSEALETER